MVSFYVGAVVVPVFLYFYLSPIFSIIYLSVIFFTVFQRVWVVPSIAVFVIHNTDLILAVMSYCIPFVAMPLLLSKQNYVTTHVQTNTPRSQIHLLVKSKIMFE